MSAAVPISSRLRAAPIAAHRPANPAPNTTMRAMALLRSVSGPARDDAGRLVISIWPPRPRAPSGSRPRLPDACDNNRILRVLLLDPGLPALQPGAAPHRL